ncbi:MAG: hypothetical protein ABI867_31545 [Kofleriaceae bacterium]
MSNVIQPIDLEVLAAVTGGSHHGSSSSYGSSVLNEISGLASSIKSLTTQTSGMSSTQMMLLCVLAMRNQQASSSVVYVARGPRYW